MRYKLTESGAVMGEIGGEWRLSFIPGSGNSDAIRYQMWLDEGNTPEPADEIPEGDSPTQGEIVEALLLAAEGKPAKLDAIKARREE